MATQSAPAVWAKFLSHSLAARLSPSTFESYIPLIATKNPLTSPRICDIFLRPNKYNDVSLDPRIPRYLQILLSEGLVDCAGILKALLKYSSFQSFRMDHTNAGGDGLQRENREEKKRWGNSYAVEEMLFYRLAKTISSGQGPRDAQEAVEVLLLCMKWMEIVTMAMGSDAHEMLNLGAHHGSPQEMGMVGMALGTMMVAVVGNEKILGVLGKANCPKGRYAK